MILGLISPDFGLARLGRGGSESEEGIREIGPEPQPRVVSGRGGFRAWLFEALCHKDADRLDQIQKLGRQPRPRERIISPMTAVIKCSSRIHHQQDQGAQITKLIARRTCRAQIFRACPSHLNDLEGISSACAGLKDLKQR